MTDFMAESIAASESEVGSHAGTIDLTTADLPLHAVRRPSDGPAGSDSSRSFGGSMNPSKLVIAGCIVGIPLIAVAIALGALSIQKSNEALALATINAETIENEQSVVIGENASGPSTGSTSVITAKPSLKPTSKPTPKPTPNVPTEPHPLNPKWYQSTHADYQSFDEATTMHSYLVGLAMCHSRSTPQLRRKLCSYETYCPDGQGSQPFGGGPPQAHNSASLEEAQWSPYEDPDAKVNPKGFHWVQIGRVPGDRAGTEENDFVTCWKYDDWTAGSREDIEDVWGEENRMWILCCDAEDEKEGVAEEDLEMAVTPRPSPKPVSKPTTADAASNAGPHPLNPKWYHTTHEEFLPFKDMDTMHSFHKGTAVCNTQSTAAQARSLCGYETYCPDGRGSQPFDGGPTDAEAAQWSPYSQPNPDSNPALTHWVQIGVVPEDRSGTEENGFMSCWKYEDTIAGTGEDIQNVWEEENRMWILCCDVVSGEANEGETEEEDGVGAVMEDLGVFGPV